MNRIGPLLAVTIAILAIGYSNALVEWGSHHAGWLLFVAVVLVFMFFAVGDHVIDLVLEHRQVRRVRSREVSRPSSLPRRAPGSLPRPDGSSHGSVHARAATRPRARAGGDLPVR